MVNLHFGLGGHFTIHKGKLDTNGEPVTREYVTGFNNMITDAGLYRIGNNADWMDFMHLGTGMTPPTPQQNSLVNTTYIGSNVAPMLAGEDTRFGVNTVDSENTFCWITRVFRVSPRGVSQTYSELGVGWRGSNDEHHLFSRTLIKDSLGNPSTVSILGDEYLDVTYEVRMYIPTDTAIYTVSPTGDDLEPREVKVHASNIKSSGAVFGWSLGYRKISKTLAHSICGSTYDYNHNRFMSGESGGLFEHPKGEQLGYTFNANTVERLSDTSMAFHFNRDLPDNIGTIRTFQVSQTGYCFQMEFNPPFIKTSGDKFDISYSISWGRQ